LWEGKEEEGEEKPVLNRDYLPDHMWPCYQAAPASRRARTSQEGGKKGEEKKKKITDRREEKGGKRRGAAPVVVRTYLFLRVLSPGYVAVRRSQEEGKEGKMSPNKKGRAGERREGRPTIFRGVFRDALHTQLAAQGRRRSQRRKGEKRREGNGLSLAVPVTPPYLHCAGAGGGEKKKKKKRVLTGKGMERKRRFSRFLFLLPHFFPPVFR